MILRRLTDALRKQDWVTVLIETLIVVLGVFLGLQVNNWNAARAERASERVLLQRLQAETHALLNTQKEELAARRPRLDVLEAIHPVLFSLPPTRPLTDVECGAIGGSHVLPAPTDDLPTLDEIISSGRFDLISDPEVKQALREYAVLQDRSRRAQVASDNEVFRLHSRHPDAFWIDLAPDAGPADAAPATWPAGDGYTWHFRCDIEAIRNSKRFLNEYADNNSRLNSYIGRFEQSIAVLADLDAELAKELGSSGPDNSQEGTP